jgi:HAMP domain-containing protein
MKLLAKFTLVFLVVFGAGGLFASYLSYRFLQDDARDQVLQQARLMMETMLSARNYTTLQIKPLLVVQQEHQRSFLPQTVPAYAATESFNYLRRKYPEYAYKEATLNPTNPRDRATDWEADVINNFRNRADQHELIGERNTPTGKYLFLAQPIHAAQPCLECHDTAQAAPDAMVRRYGAANGFGWKLNETVGAQIVSVPFSVPVQMADRAFTNLMTSLGIIALVSLVVLDLLLLFTIVRPVARLSSMADQASLGNLDVPELPVSGKDEISVLAGSFNRMRRSLVSALKMLEGH